MSDGGSGAHRITVADAAVHVRIDVDGVTVAESSRPRVLREGSLPPRNYLPRDDVRTELLVPTTTSTTCPFKGQASYWSLEIDGRRHDDLVWSYESPIPEMSEITGMLCFFDERVDMYLDGEPQVRPETPWSQPANR